MAAEIRDPVAAVRRFNRYYTRAIGLLDRGYLGTPYTVAEGRVLYEIAQGQGDGAGVTAKTVGESLGLDAGYLSRIVTRLERDGVVARTPLPTDGRSFQLQVTPAGQSVFEGFNESSNTLVAGLIDHLSAPERGRLVDAVGTIQALLDRDRDRPAAAPVTLRAHGPGDMGWIVERHGVLYGREYGWGPGIEAVTARICADFLEHFDPAKERCWIAERAGERVGCVFLVKDEAPDTARLRLLLLDPGARGTGLGRRLADECIAFARAAGYREIVLWTHAVLTAARKIYAATGFEITETWEHDEFGHTEVSETWRLRL